MYIHIYTVTCTIPYDRFFTNFANDMYAEIHEIYFHECIVDSNTNYLKLISQITTYSAKFVIFKKNPHACKVSISTKVSTFNIFSALNFFFLASFKASTSTKSCLTSMVRICPIFCCWSERTSTARTLQCIIRPYYKVKLLIYVDITQL